MLGVFWSVLLDIQATLGDDSSPWAKVAAIDGYIRERVPGRYPAIIPGATPDDVAGIIAGQLIRGAGPATGIFAGLMGRDIRLDVIGPHMRAGRDEEVSCLRLRDGDRLYVREGYLMAGTIPCARVSLRLVPDRVTEQVSGTAWGLIRSGIPVGTVLGRHGLRRGHRTAEVIPGGNPAVKSRGVIFLGALPVGIATEEVPEDLCIRLAARGV